MKQLLFIALLMLGVLTTLQAQQTIEYGYDPNGNRIYRHVVTIGGANHAKQFQEPVAEETNGAQTVVIYPNPTKGIFSIGITGLESDKQNGYTLFDLSGKIIKQGVLTSDRTSVDVTWNAAGIYLLDVNLGGNITRWKVVKQ
jgi:hypothetical protein